METGLTPTPRRNDFSGKDIFTYFGHRDNRIIIISEFCCFF